jgi:nitrite reductase/ring-hydroxylating ferredoxin subunit
MHKRRLNRIPAYTREFLLTLLVVFSCNRDLTDDPIPVIPFPDLNINLAFPEYQPLMLDGGYKEISKIGVRGVILYRKNATTYIAYERNCSFHPNDACATVNVHTSSLYMTDPCCGSNFSFTDGTPTGGAAWRPLRKYRTVLSGGMLTISNEMVN